MELSAKVMLVSELLSVSLINKTPYIATAVCAIVVGGIPVILEVLRNNNMDVYNYTSTLAVYGFFLSYLLISIAAPVYLFKRKQLKPVHLVTAAAAVILVCIPLVGSVYPLPTYPMVVLPFIFLGWMAVSLVWCIIAKNHHSEVYMKTTESIQEDFD